MSNMVCGISMGRLRLESDVVNDMHFIGQCFVHWTALCDLLESSSLSIVERASDRYA